MYIERYKVTNTYAKYTKCIVNYVEIYKLCAEICQNLHVQQIKALFLLWHLPSWILFIDNELVIALV